MPVTRYVICDECGETKTRYTDLSDWQNNVHYEDVFDEDQYVEVEDWTVHAFPDEEDPIVVDADFYCPGCKP